MKLLSHNYGRLMDSPLRDIKVGTIVNIWVVDISGKQISPNYSSKIHQLNDKTVDIEIPEINGQTICLELFCLVHMEITAEDGICSFFGKLAGRGKNGNTPIMNIAVESSITKIERREYFRYKMKGEVKYRLYNPDTTDPEAEPFNSSKLLNISGGGFCLLSVKRFEIMELVECIINLHNNFKINVIARVITIFSDENNKGWKIGMRFESITAQEREYLINIILAEQLSLIRKR